MATARKSSKPRSGNRSSDNEADQVDLSKLTPIVGRGIYAAEMHGGAPFKAVYAVVDDQSLSLSLEDGRKVTVPIDWYPRLVHASPVERNDWRPIMGGRAVLWERLGIAVSVKAVLEGTKSQESVASLKRWLAGRGGERQKRTAV